MEKIKVTVSGYTGHMGSIVCKLLEDNPLFEFFDGVDENKFSFKAGTDVIIDFSVPQASIKMLEVATELNVPVVIATTGFSDVQEERILKASKTIPIFKSANMSFEVALLKNTLKQLASKLQNSDIEIVETHHNRKIDSPSGTAKLLAEAINDGLESPRNIVYGRQGKREADEIGIASLRGGNIVGEHSVKFFNKFETLEITHTAHSRELFAEGSIKAAEFIVNQKPGLYTMDDLF